MDTPRINPDLTSGSVDLTGAVRLPENARVAFMGDIKGGAFDISGDQAREWLLLPANPNGRPNADVLKPRVNGMDLTRRRRASGSSTSATRCRRPTRRFMKNRFGMYRTWCTQCAG